MVVLSLYRWSRKNFHWDDSLFCLPFLITTVVVLARLHTKTQGHFHISEEAGLSFSTENLTLVLVQISWGSNQQLSGGDRGQIFYHMLSSSGTYLAAVAQWDSNYHILAYLLESSLWGYSIFYQIQKRKTRKKRNTVRHLHCLILDICLCVLHLPLKTLFFFLVLAYDFNAVTTEALKYAYVRQLKEFNVDNVNFPLGLWQMSPEFVFTVELRSPLTSVLMYDSAFGLNKSYILTF